MYWIRCASINFGDNIIMTWLNLNNHLWGQIKNMKRLDSAAKKTIFSYYNYCFMQFLHESFFPLRCVFLSNNHIIIFFVSKPVEEKIQLNFNQYFNLSFKRIFVQMILICRVKWDWSETLFLTTECHTQFLVDSGHCNLLI